MRVKHSAGLAAALMGSLLVSACGSGSDGSSTPSTGASTTVSNTITLNTLYAFGSSSTDASAPGAPYILGSDGNLYGISNLGGAYGYGAVFKITASGTESILYSFGSAASDGSQPTSLIEGSDGNFYGTTFTGGANGTGSCVGATSACFPGYGTIFKLTPAGAETLLYSFGNTSVDGINPNGLIQASDGNLYGTTNIGGTSGYGTVFKISTSGIESSLYSFGANGSGDGRTPSAGLIQGSNGLLYGTTSLGGSAGYGTVFQISTGGTEAVLHSFGSVSGDGLTPNASVTEASNGNLVGTTTYGGAKGLGTVFSLTTSGTESILYSFGQTSVDGTLPYSAVAQGADGNFYGTTYSGGANGTTLCSGATTTCYPGYGTVFELTPTGVETVLYSFDSTATDGIYPANGLIEVNGIFYGSTTAGGAHNDGTFFSFTN